MNNADGIAKRSPGATRVVVLGGGFGGVYTALHLERLAAKGAPVQVSLVNRENYLVFQPMLAEVIAGDVGILDTVSPLRQLLEHTAVRARDRGRGHGSARGEPRRRAHTAQHELAFDHLVVALGNVTDFRGSPVCRSTRCRSRRSPTRCASATM